MVIRSAQRFASVPRLTALHDEAFDAVKSLANDPRFKLEMDFQTGDIQFVNNLVDFYFVASSLKI